MAYPETCAGALAALEDMRAVAYAYGVDAAGYAYDASVHWLMGKDNLAIEDLCSACEANARGIKNIAGLVEPFSPLSPLEWYLTHGCVEAAVTWKGICEAWLKDDFEGRAPTIAIIDRMRQILWDEPFNITWAARPEDKEL
ncbi:hypothetical protein ES707_09384 [subsurface metagenome]